MIILLVFIIQIVICRKFLYNPFIPQILPHQRLVHCQSFLLIERKNLRQILPSSCRHIGTPFHGSLYLVKVLFFQFQVTGNHIMDALISRIFLPNTVIRFHFQHFQPVHSHHVKIPHRFIVFRRIPGSHNHPSFRHFMSAKHFVLQKLQHGRSQRL